jgi:lactoylglutathione lyase
MATRLGYCALYVVDVIAALDFYERAFGLRRRMVEPPLYGELETGDTVLAFTERRYATELVGDLCMPRPGDPPMSIEVSFVTDDVEGLYRRALDAGAEHLRPPEVKPWGATVAFVRDMDGYLVSICTPPLVPA